MEASLGRALRLNAYASDPKSLGVHRGSADLSRQWYLELQGRYPRTGEAR